jgi:uncharacterized protein
MKIQVRVQPRAKKNAIAGRLGDAWKLQVTAPALEGKANEACSEFLARGLGIARSRVRLISGEKSRNKVFDLDGIGEAEFLLFASGEKK